MEIGWLCYGFIHQDFIAADGAANIRIPIINKLLNNNNIYFLGPKRKQEHNQIQFIDNYHSFCKFYDIQNSVKETMINYKFDNLPKLDVLFVETNAMGLISSFFASIINYYYQKNTKILIWDEDNLYSNFKSKLKIFNIDINDILILTPYSTIKNKKQKIIYYPYNFDNELPIKKGENIVYVGNDYRRRNNLKRLYDIEEADIYGKWKNDEFNSTVKCNFKHQIKPLEVHKTLNKYLFSIQIVRSDYAKIGLMTQRMNEVLESGTLLLADKRIKDINKFIDEKYLVENMADVRNKLDFFKNIDEHEYIRLVIEQRKKIKEYFKYDDILNVILDEQIR